VSRVHDLEATRAHCGIAADRDDWIGHVASMQHSGDQTLDYRFGAVPVDGNRYTAHGRFTPEPHNRVSIDH
jgi:hypothetical protein